MTVTVGQCVGDRRDKELSVGAAQPAAEQHKYIYIVAQIQLHYCTNTITLVHKYNYIVAQIQLCHCTNTITLLHKRCHTGLRLSRVTSSAVRSDIQSAKYVTE